MGIENRDYIRIDRQSRRPSPFSSMRFWSITTWLIAINVAVFLLNAIIVRSQTFVDDFGYLHRIRTHPIEDLGFFSVNAAVFHLQLWRFLTFQFLHADISHIVFNMLALFFFGPLVESYLTPRRYLGFYLLCGVAGPLMYIALWASGLFIHDAVSPMVGASAGIFGVLIAASIIAPNATVLVRGIIPASLRVVAWCALGYAIYTVLFTGNNAGGEAAHIGGAIAGAALFKNPQVLRFFDFRRGPRMRYRG